MKAPVAEVIELQLLVAVNRLDKALREVAPAGGRVADALLDLRLLLMPVLDLLEAGKALRDVVDVPGLPT